MVVIPKKFPPTLITFKTNNQRFNSTEEIQKAITSAIDLCIKSTKSDVDDWIMENVPRRSGQLQQALLPEVGEKTLTILSDLPYIRSLNKKRPFLKGLKATLKERGILNLYKGLRAEGLQ